MSRVNLEDNILHDPIISRGWRMKITTVAPVTGQPSAIIDMGMTPIIILNPAAAATLRMPASGPATQGLCFLMANGSANIVTVNAHDGSAFTTAISIGAGETTTIFCTGSSTIGLGWRAVGTTSSGVLMSSAASRSGPLTPPRQDKEPDRGPSGLPGAKPGTPGTPGTPMREGEPRDEDKVKGAPIDSKQVKADDTTHDKNEKGPPKK